MRHLLIAGALVALGGPALAQTGASPAPIKEPGPPVVSNPAQPPQAVPQGGSPDIANSGPAATGTIARSGTGADNVSNNTAETLISSQPSRAIPPTGGGGGGDGGGN